ncbi:LytTR family DNA-binding domain-containing protein [Pleionea sp. CnH1-48]|uniref:LytR/AlgR family response regulator transcription factor n=1 Tax=Pleionea sp. CnH1-48 TaxID=2954494 RepID=UPI002097BFBE|nr:LytTR family DNA-binding domain-containing protein [Pleionea sp. CnH1-48]MCO7225571.1 LytTR family DNA-binding domain-containing protein [Pleionea sp. CnH1-48]
MINILIVEDVALVADCIADLCREYFSRCRVDIVNSTSMAKNRLDTNQYDLMLLDLNINGADGYSVLEHRNAKTFYTIVITASPEKAARAFDFGVLDFVTKPVSVKRFHQAMRRFENIEKSSRIQISQLSVKSQGELTLVPVEEIDFIKASGNYSEIVTKTGQRLLHDKSMEQLASLLEDSFLRVHRSYLAQKSLIRSVVNHGAGKYSVTLKTGSNLPMSRAVYKQEYKDKK